MWEIVFHLIEHSESLSLCCYLNCLDLHMLFLNHYKISKVRKWLSISIGSLILSVATYVHGSYHLRFRNFTRDFKMVSWFPCDTRKIGTPYCDFWSYLWKNLRAFSKRILSTKDNCITVSKQRAGLANWLGEELRCLSKVNIELSLMVDKLDQGWKRSFRERVKPIF